MDWEQSSKWNTKVFELKIFYTLSLCICPHRHETQQRKIDWKPTKLVRLSLRKNSKFVLSMFLNNFWDPISAQGGDGVWKTWHSPIRVYFLILTCYVVMEKLGKIWNPNKGLFSKVNLLCGYGEFWKRQNNNVQIS